MKVIVYLNHPAHFHLFKNLIVNLNNDGHAVKIISKKKDILDDLLTDASFEYTNILSQGRKDSKIGMLYSFSIKSLRLIKETLNFKPDLIIGTAFEYAHVSKLLNIPFISVSEDDATAAVAWAKYSYPFAKHVLSPTTCNNLKWNNKTIRYEGYHELAYLHPNHFIPDINVVKKYFDIEKPYVIIRFAKLTANHDSGIQGINTDIASNMINLLKPYVDIYITSERELEQEFEQYRIKIKPLDMHHILAFAKFYIGDSQTMAAEAGVLGTPFVRFNDFVGRIGYLQELEEKYKLGYGIKTNNVDKFYQVIEELISSKDLKSIYSKRRDKMLSEKIDMAKFLTWLVEEYPESVKINKTNPDFQNKFK